MKFKWLNHSTIEKMNVPVYTISTKTIDLVARIAEKLGEIRGAGEYSRNLRLRKINRLRSIQSSLAIENNTLTLGQVTDIIEGKRVLGLPHEIQEVKNAYQAYEHLLEYDPYKVKDFLKAHQFMTTQLVKEAGHFRSQGVGVFEGNKLYAILQALEELPARKITDIFTDINTDKLTKTEIEFLGQIAGYIDKNGEITNYRAQLLTNKSDISVKKYFAKFVEHGLLKVEGKNKGRKYKINKKNNDE